MYDLMNEHDNLYGHRGNRQRYGKRQKDGARSKMRCHARRKRVRVAVLFLSLLLPSFFLIAAEHAEALAVYAYTDKVVVWEPGKVSEHLYRIEDTKKDITITPDGDLAQYATASRDIIRADDENRALSVTLRLPAEKPEPGDHKIYLNVFEVASTPEGTIGTAVRILEYIIVRVPYPDKYLLVVDHDNTQANEGEPVTFSYYVENRGSVAIESAEAIVEVTELDGRSRGMARGERKAIPAGASSVLSATFDTAVMPAGKYRADATVMWDDGEPRQVERKFKIGGLVIHVVDYTENYSAGTINPYTITVESGWNQPIENVYAEVSIGSAMAKSPPIRLEPWQQEDIEGFIDLTGVQEGLHPFRAKLHYEGQSTIYENSVQVIAGEAQAEEEQPSGSNWTVSMMIIIIAIVAAIVIGDVIWLRRMQKRLRQQKSK